MASQKIPVARPRIGERERELVEDCLRSGWISSLGRYIGEFEERFADFCGVGHGVAVMNGTAALHLALLALGVGPGDEVLVPSLTFVATANAVTYTGARPVFVDSEPATGNLDVSDLERRITPASRAVIAAHLYGHPADMVAIGELVQRRGLALIEDAAEAHGAQILGEAGWRRVGSWGEAACFSFYGNKILTTGEGGMLVTDREDIARRARSLRDHGMSPDRVYWHPEIGYNYRMTNLQAAIGLGQLERVEEILAGKREVARLYQEGLAGIAGLRLPRELSWARSVFWMYSPLVGEEYPLDRDGLRRALEERGIDTRPFFHPLHTLPPYRREVELPVCQDLSRRGLNLPSGPDISPGEISRVCQALRDLGGRP